MSGRIIAIGDIHGCLAALETFRRALSLCPDLQGVRAQVEFLQRELRR